VLAGNSMTNPFATYSKPQPPDLALFDPHSTTNDVHRKHSSYSTIDDKTEADQLKNVFAANSFSDPSSMKLQEQKILKEAGKN
jgi:hypothetical protein